MRSKPYIALLPPVAAVTLVVAGLGIFDFTNRDKIAKGVIVSGVDIGGLNREQARAKLRADLMPALERPVEIQMKGRTFRLRAKESRIAVDLEGTIDDAIAAGRTGFFIPRAASTLAGVKHDKQLTADVGYSEAAVKRVVRRVQKGTSVKPIDAHFDFTPETGFKLVRSASGVTIDRKKLEAEIRSALVKPGSERSFKPDVKYDAPKIRTADLARQFPTLLVVDRSKFKLTLYKNLKKAKTYGVAVGAAGLETPPGKYTIANKAENPVWHVPDSDWAGDLAGKTIPGGVPENPIRARWLGIYDGVGIHGTNDPDSIGSNASHGCIRMRVPEVIKLYREVPVGTTIYIS